MSGSAALPQRNTPIRQTTAVRSITRRTLPRVCKDSSKKTVSSVNTTDRNRGIKATRSAEVAPRACTPRPQLTVFADVALLRNPRSEEHTSELQSLAYLVCRLLLEKKK